MSNNEHKPITLDELQQNGRMLAERAERNPWIHAYRAAAQRAEAAGHDGPIGILYANSRWRLSRGFRPAREPQVELQADRLNERRPQRHLDRVAGLERQRRANGLGRHLVGDRGAEPDQLTATIPAAKARLARRRTSPAAPARAGPSLRASRTAE